MSEKINESMPGILKSCSLYIDLKVAVIKVVEKLSKDIFIKLKEELVRNNLLSTPEVKTLRNRNRRLINDISKTVDSTRSNEILELLINKNILLISIGFIHILDSLLSILVSRPVPIA